MKIFFAFLISSTLLADDIVLIRADRIVSELGKSTSNVELIDEKKLAETNAQTLPELLRENSSVLISNGSIFLRGTDSSHTLIVLDGIVLNDPSNPNRSFDISRLSLNNIKSIEILKGSQGLLYGANAIGGVIVITSKTQGTSELSGSSFLSYGTYQTVNFGLNAQKKIDIHQLSFGAEHFKTNGFSAADIKLNPNAEPDGEKRSNLNFHSVSDFSAHSILETSFRFTHDVLDIDNCGGADCDDRNNQLTNEEFFSRIQYNHVWNSELLETRFFYSRGKYSHFNRQQTSSTLSKGEINTFGINHTNYFTDTFTQNINFDFSKESNQINQSNENSSVFLYHKYDVDTYLYNFGLRLDHNKIFGNHFTYKLAAAKKLNKENLFRLSYSTGFKAPGLFQFLDPTYGNINLKPEKSRTFELGHEWKNNSTQLQSSFFVTTIYDQFIYIDSLQQTVNSGTTHVTGIEESLATSFSKTSATLLGRKQEHRPQVLLKNTFFYENFSLESEYVGKREDAFWTASFVRVPVTMPSYFISHINYAYKKAFIKIKNIFNTEYEEVYGYGTGGRMITVGLKSDF